MLQRIEGTKLSYFCEAERTRPSRRKVWFLCDCGSAKAIELYSVISFNTISCGCVGNAGRPKLRKPPCTCGKTAIYSDGKCRKCYEKHLRKTNPEFAERQRQNQRDWAKRNPDRIRELQIRRATDPNLRLRDKKTKRDSYLKSIGTSSDEVARLYEKGCAICGTRNHLHVDHDHKTGQFRGILCSKHNNGLGFLGDNIEGLEKALEYLRTAEKRRTQR